MAIRPRRTDPRPLGALVQTANIVKEAQMAVSVAAGRVLRDSSSSSPSGTFPSKPTQPCMQDQSGRSRLCWIQKRPSRRQGPPPERHGPAAWRTRRGVGGSIRCGRRSPPPPEVLTPGIGTYSKRRKRRRDRDRGTIRVAPRCSISVVAVRLQNPFLSALRYKKDTRTIRSESENRITLTRRSADQRRSRSVRPHK